MGKGSLFGKKDFITSPYYNIFFKTNPEKFESVDISKI